VQCKDGTSFTEYDDKASSSKDAEKRAGRTLKRIGTQEMRPKLIKQMQKLGGLTKCTAMLHMVETMFLEYRERRNIPETLKFAIPPKREMPQT